MRLRSSSNSNPWELVLKNLATSNSDAGGLLIAVQRWATPAIDKRHRHLDNLFGGIVFLER